MARAKKQDEQAETVTDANDVVEAPVEAPVEAEAIEAPRQLGRITVTKPVNVVLSNYQGTLPGGKVLCEAHYDAADWRTLQGYARRLRWEVAA